MQKITKFNISNSVFPEEPEVQREGIQQIDPLKNAKEDNQVQSLKPSGLSELFLALAKTLFPKDPPN